MKSNRILISFLGKGRNGKPAKGETAGRSGYATTKYRFENGDTFETSVFGWALWQYLRRGSAPPQKWLVLGTPGSLWGAMADPVLESAPKDAILGGPLQEAMEWSISMDEASRKDAVSPRDLQRGQEMLAPPLDVPELRFELIGNCADRDSQKGLMGTLMRHVTEGAEIVLDVTHGYRHFGVIAAFMLQALRWLRKVRVAGLYYGAREMRKGKDPASVVDLSVCADYADMASALATFGLTGNYREMAPFFPGASDHLDRACFLENLNQLDEAKAHAKKALKELEKIEAGDAFRNGASAKLRGALAWSSQETGVQQMIEKSDIFRKRQDYIKSVILAYEATTTHAIHTYMPEGDTERYDEKTIREARKRLKRILPEEDRDRFGILHDLRNAIGHGSRPWDPRVCLAMRDRAAFEKLLKELLDFAKRLIGGKLEPGTDETGEVGEAETSGDNESPPEMEK